MTGNRHDRPRSVGRQDIVGEPDWDVLSGERMDSVGTGEDASLFAVLGSSVGVAKCFRRLLVLLDPCSIFLGDRKLLDDSVLRGEDAEGDTVNCVDASGEDVKVKAFGVRNFGGALGSVEVNPCLLLTCPGYSEGELATFGSSDPVALHCLNALGPVDGVEVVDQFLGVFSDAEVPLGNPLLLDKSS